MISISLDLGEGVEALSMSEYMPGFVPPGVESVVLPCQTHTANVGEATVASMEFPDTDALVTRDPRIAIGVRTADCVPIALYAPDVNMAGVVHAGWRGTVGRIVANTVDRLISFGADPESIRVAFGPSICGRCYETGEELASVFLREGMDACVLRGGMEDPCGEKIFDDSTVRIDLEAANRIILAECGISERNITSCGICTRHKDYPHSAWPSWRRQPGLARRLVTMVWLNGTND